jgi:hypothetical protein
MNGRVYDPVIGRFLSPDPFVQAPYSSQSYNRYSYVWNNPLSMVDPSGYAGLSIDVNPSEEDLFTMNIASTRVSNGFANYNFHYEPLVTNFLSSGIDQTVGTSYFSLTIEPDYSRIDSFALNHALEYASSTAYNQMVKGVYDAQQLLGISLSVNQGNLTRSAYSMYQGLITDAVSQFACSVGCAINPLADEIMLALPMGAIGGAILRRGVTNNTKFYRYVGEGEAQVIKRTGKIPNVDAAGNPKDVYLTERFYKTAGRAKTHNQLPSKPSYRVEIDPGNVPNRTPFSRVNPTDNPQWGIGGGVESITRDAIKVDPSTLTRLKGG